MSETPTLFDLINDAPTEATKPVTTWEQFTIPLYTHETQFPDATDYETLSMPLKEGTITCHEKDFLPMSVTDMSFCNSSVSIKVNLNKFTTANDSRIFFDMPKFMDQTKTIAHIADDIFEMKTTKLSNLIEQLKEGNTKHQREITFLENIRDRQAMLREVCIKFSQEKSLLASIGLQAPYDSYFITEIKNLFTIKITEESISMAKSRGPFPAFTAATDINQQLTHIIQLKSKPLFDEMIKFGRRNSFVL